MFQKKGIRRSLGVPIFAAAHFFVSCSGKAGKTMLTVLDQRILDSIPSGSGLVVRNDSAFVIGDDATAFYELNVNDYQQRKISITGLSATGYREPKPVKHDFEALTAINWGQHEYLLAFGSGSNHISRDSMLMINIGDMADQRMISLEHFYENLRRITKTAPKDWNIEGAASIDSNLFLLNRGNNLLIICNLKEFLSNIFDTASRFPAIRYQQLKLPSIGHHEARLSGTCMLDNSHLLFCASVEDTPDWTKDGPILGSLVGVYSLRERTVSATNFLTDNRDNLLKQKIESLDVVTRDLNGDVISLAIGDNDNGTSRIFRLRLKHPE